VSPELIGGIGVVILLILIFCRMWIGLAFAVAGFLGIVAIKGLGPAFGVISSVQYDKVANYSLSTIPFFLLMGVLIANSKIGEQVFDAARTWVGHVRGGLSMATIVASAVFAAMTGISTASEATLIKVALPQMRRFGYADTLSTASITASGTLAFLIPPSLIFVFYGILTEQSIGKMYMAGILPGILLAICMIITVFFITRRHPQLGPAGPKTKFREKITSLKFVWPVIIIIIIILGGIYIGVFTATEGGAIGAFGTVIVIAALRQFKLKMFLNALAETARMSGMIFFLIVGANIFMKFLAMSRVTFMLSNWVGSLNIPPLAVMGVIAFIYVILGMFFDVIAAILLTVPILFPIAVGLGFDPIWFGVIITLLVQLGLLTPPIGMDVFVVSGMSGVPATTIFRGLVPFFFCIFAVIVILIFFPQISTFLPNRMTVK